MLNIRVDEDCGNAPKKLLLRDFEIAFAQNDVAHLREQVAADIHWNRVGDKVLEGAEAMAAEMAAGLAQSQSPKATELTLTNIITHGKTGAVDGMLTLEDGSSYAFCHVYSFSSNAKNAKIKAITAYVIAL